MTRLCCFSFTGSIWRNIHFPFEYSIQTFILRASQQTGSCGEYRFTLRRLLPSSGLDGSVNKYVGVLVCYCCEMSTRCKCVAQLCPHEKHWVWTNTEALMSNTPTQTHNTRTDAYTGRHGGRERERGERDIWCWSDLRFADKKRLMEYQQKDFILYWER